jgi:hypothetical protein
MLPAHPRHAPAALTSGDLLSAVAPTNRHAGPQSICVQDRLSGVSFPHGSVDLHDPPADFDALVAWFERWSYGLVLLEEYPLTDVRRALLDVERGVREHLRTFDTVLVSPVHPTTEPAEVRSILRADHAWFLVSLEQLEWFYRVVEGEDHGGHRQALGQYGCVLAEALRRHRDVEQSYVARRPYGVGAPPR